LSIFKWCAVAFIVGAIDVLLVVGVTTGVKKIVGD
jgi:hypothetical protein